MTWWSSFTDSQRFAGRGKFTFYNQIKLLFKYGVAVKSTRIRLSKRTGSDRLEKLDPAPVLDKTLIQTWIIPNKIHPIFLFFREKKLFYLDVNILS